MAAFFERQRRVIFSATVALWAMSSLATYVERSNFEGWKPNDWIGGELYGLPLGICAMLAGLGQAALAPMGRCGRIIGSEYCVFCLVQFRLLTIFHG